MHRPLSAAMLPLVTQAGFEPATSCSGGKRSIQAELLGPSGGRYWIRTSDFYRVKVALYH